MSEDRENRARLLAAACALAAVLAWGVRAGDAGASPNGAPPAAATEPAAADPNVVGGTPVPEEKWRDTAGVYMRDDLGCTGVLVAPDVVLTAGHCADGSITRVKLDANNVNDAGEVISVEQEIAYPDWWRAYDLGVLVLESESAIEPRVITTGCVRDRYLADGANVAIVGYGAIDANGTQYTSDLMEGFTTITDHDCSSSSGCQSAARPDGELGAGGLGVDSCFGDSGGPLYLLTERGDFLIGITSRGYDDNTLPCSQGGIYVRPDKIIEWIEEQSGRQLPRAVCNFEPVPSAEPIEVEAGDTGASLVLANDRDEGDNHTFSVAQAPEYGEVTVDSDGLAKYEADSSYEGPDSFVIAVTDDGDPNLTGNVEILVTVLAPQGCGCRGDRGDGNALLVVLVAIGLVLRRRG